MTRMTRKEASDFTGESGYRTVIGKLSGQQARVGLIFLGKLLENTTFFAEFIDILSISLTYPDSE